MLPLPLAPTPVSEVPADQSLTGPIPAPLSTPAARRPGPRLRADDRAVLRELLVRYHDIRTVQTLLRDEYPELPPVSDRYLRDVRIKLLRRQNPDLRQALHDLQSDAFSQGLAVRAHRVLELTRTHGVLLQRELATTEPAQQIAITRERRAILAQIAREVQDLDQHAINNRANPSLPHPSPSATAAGVEPEALADLVHMLCAKLWAAEIGSPVDFSAYGPVLGDAMAELQSLLAQRSVANMVPTVGVPA